MMGLFRKSEDSTLGTKKEEVTFIRLIFYTFIFIVIINVIATLFAYFFLE